MSHYNSSQSKQKTQSHTGAVMGI